ncbi:MAG: glycosyltransferase family 39 protein [Bacteroidales bacterium]|jgi:4-amino-4-deoxy-L-arabinose transferase-like glycosyltransferase
MEKRLFSWLFAAITLVYLYSMWSIELMENDATQYATICQQMVEDNSWLTIHWREVEYLDKPPLLFWTSAALFKVFGSSHFVYRISSFLVLLLGVFSIYKFGIKLYNQRVARLAVLIFYSSLAVLLMVHDVRTDTMLTGFVIFSLWQLYLYLDQRKGINFLGAFTGIGLSMLTKGPLGLIIPMIAFGPYLLLKGQWRDLFKWQWLAGLLWVGILLSPMLFGLYTQHGSTGLKFYFWTQSFGRLTGENSWVDNTEGIYFVHTYLWTFLPWSILGIKALYSSVLRSFKKPLPDDFFLTSAVLVVFVAMSFSQYKLPHYIYVVFPMIALLMANDLMKMKEEASIKPWSIVQTMVGMILLTLAFLIIVFVFPGFPILGWVVVVGLILLMVMTFWFENNLLSKTIVVSLLSMVVLNFVLVVHFYPNLLIYQASSQLASQIKTLHINPNQVCFLNSHRPAFDFYYGHRVPDYKKMADFEESLSEKQELYVVAFERKSDSINLITCQVDTLIHLKGFKVSQLTLPFLNATTRSEVLHDCYFLKVTKKEPSANAQPSGSPLV